MRQITTLNDEYKQKFKFPISGYSDVFISIEFKPNQFAWFMNLTWDDFVLNNERLGVHPNLLRQFRNILKFGICITHPAHLDPYDRTAWLNGWSFYMLDEDDIEYVEDTFYVRS